MLQPANIVRHDDEDPRKTQPQPSPSNFRRPIAGLDPELTIGSALTTGSTLTNRFGVLGHTGHPLSPETGAAGELGLADLVPATGMAQAAAGGGS